MARLSAAGLRHRGILLSMLLGFAVPASNAADRTDLPPVAGAPRVNSTPDIAARPALDFDIPAQPLAAALSRYGDISDQPAVFASDLVAARTSSAIRGRYSSEAALRLLLEGTGLAVEKITSDLGETFLLKEAGTPPARASLASFFSAETYPALIQKRIWEALCANARTVPGRYSSLFRFKVDASGDVRDALLLDSTGDARRDAALLETLQRVHIDLPPPATVAQQPLTMRLRVAEAHPTPPCAQEQVS